MSLLKARVLRARSPIRALWPAGAFSGSGASKLTNGVLACSSSRSLCVPSTDCQHDSSEMSLNKSEEMSLVHCDFTDCSFRLLFLGDSAIHQASALVPRPWSWLVSLARRRCSAWMSRCWRMQVRRRATTSSIGMCELYRLSKRRSHSAICCCSARQSFRVSTAAFSFSPTKATSFSTSCCNILFRRSPAFIWPFNALIWASANVHCSASMRALLYSCSPCSTFRSISVYCFSASVIASATC
mmetsp:Transcript_126200/g.403914  ORF Transcript_126200/g.403914 Transcript_126200/m.403914 type:complete len:242 (-) Transcript_126200:2457-3182(-)